MSPDLFSGLRGEALRNEAYNLFPGFYERGISANQALNELKGLGLGYRRQDFLADFAEGKGTFDQSIKVRFVGLDKTPSEGILEPLYHGVPDKYSFVFRATGIDPETGEPRTQYFFYHRNTLDTRANMEEDALNWISEQDTASGGTFDSIKLSEGYINPVWA